MTEVSAVFLHRCKLAVAVSTVVLDELKAMLIFS